MKGKGFRINRKHGMIFLAILILGSSLTAFMSSSYSAGAVNILVKFSDYEYYQFEVKVTDNTSLLQAVSDQYYVRLENESLYCIRSTCNGDDGVWLSFDKDGYYFSPDSLVLPGSTYYMIFNKTVVNDTTNKDTEAIRKLLKL